VFLSYRVVDMIDVDLSGEHDIFSVGIFGGLHVHM
jgi:hypothetical protein